MSRNQLLKEVNALIKELDASKYKVLSICKLNKYELKSMLETLTQIKMAPIVECESVGDATTDDDNADYDADYSKIKHYYKKNRDTALLLK